MKLFLRGICFFLFFTTSFLHIHAQECTSGFVSNLKNGNSYFVESKPVSLRTAMDYDYEIAFVASNSEGIKIKLISSDVNIMMERDNRKVMFVSDKDERKIFDFVLQSPDINNSKNRTIYTNYILIDQTNLEWFANNNIKIFRMMDMIEKIMYPLRNIPYCCLP